MTRERKSTPQHIKAISDREVTGIFSVFGNADSYDDVIHPGAFSKTLQERGSKIVHLWQHDFGAPPIAIVKAIRELTRDELPKELLAQHPDVLGGMEVTREYLDTPRGNEVLASLKAGSPLEMSFAFDAVKFDFSEKPGAKYEWERIRNLREVRLYETSDVLWGANDATVAAKSRFPLPQLLQQLELYVSERKAGSRNSAVDLERIETIARLAVELGATNVSLKEAEEGAKSRAAATALTLQRRARAINLALQCTTKE